MERLTSQEFVDQYRRTAGWGILCGSALSAAGPTFAPMVGPSLWGLLLALVDEIGLRSQALGAISRRIIRRVDRRTLIANLKLEVALSNVDGIVQGGAERVVHSLYAGRQSNANHGAIAALHDKGWARWVLTTNFDGGLEGTGHFTGVDTRLPQQNSVLKLHGDADSGRDIVATMEGLTTGRNFAFAEGAMAVLAGLGMERLLVVGYSGHGDIDILPALVGAPNKGIALWWAVKSGGSPPPGMAVAGTITHDLEKPRANVLCALADTCPLADELRHARFEQSLRDAFVRLRGVVQEFSFEQLVGICVSLLLEANFGWQPAKFLLASERLAGMPVNHDQWHLACERMSAYTASERHLRRQTEPRSGVKRASAMARRAFIVQESGRIPESRHLFAEATREFLSASEEPSFRDSDFVLRGSLESEIERCASVWRKRERSRLARELLERCNRLEQEAQHEVPSVANVLKLRRAQLVFLSADGAAARSSALRLAKEALVGSIALQHADGEGASRRFLAAVGGWEGWRMIREMTKGLEPSTERPAREVVKSLPTAFQGLLPLAMIPWKFQVPFVGPAKRLTDKLMTRRLMWRLMLWKRELPRTG